MNDHQEPRFQEHTIEPEHEFRLEVDFNKTISLKIVQGEAEIFGTELAKHTQYNFKGRKLGIFSWRGCVLQITGECSVEYTAGDTPMHSYLNTHHALEKVRDEALEKKTVGPRVIVLGPADAGKTSLCKILLNYAVKMGRKSLFIDLDTNEGSVSMPGTLSATPILIPIDVEEDFGSSPFTSNLTPLCYYYGSSDPTEKPSAYGALVKKLAEVCESKCKIDEQFQSSGYIINSPPQFSETNGYELLGTAIESFKVNVILVIGNERLFNEMKKRYSSNPSMHIIKLDKSGGVVSRDKTFKRKKEVARVREYFYGTPTPNSRADLNPYTNIVPFGNILVRRIGDSANAPSSALPLGTDRKARETRMIKVTPGDILLHSILAVSQAEFPEEEDAEDSPDLLTSNLLGFVYVSEVDDEKKVMTVLSPNPTRLAKKYLIMGGLKWVES